MATTPLAYNPSASPIAGTTQVGTLAVGTTDQDYSIEPGGVTWWMGPNEELGYVIAQSVSGNTQPTPIPGVFASVGFFQTSGFSDSEFINLSQAVSSEYGTPQTFSSATDASTWLTTNGFWNSYVASLCDSFTFTGNNATTTTTSVTNDGTSGWDSSAYSLETFTGPVSVTFQTSTNGNILMGGFSYNPTVNLGDTYVDTSYGIYLYNSDQIEIYENGGQVAVLNVGTVVSSSDVWKVDYDGTSVKYYYNSTLIYTSTNAVTQPLHVFFPLFTPNEGAVDICVIGTLTPTPTPTPTITQTPTPTVTETPTGTPSETPTNTPTPTSTDLSSVTTFTISGCTNLNVLVADLGPSALAPGDVFNFTFTGGTPSGCYRIVEKTVATPTDGATPLLFYVNCAACEASLITPTPTTTSTPTPSVTNTQTPSVTPTLTPTTTSTPTPTPTSGATAPFSVSFVESGSNILMSYSGTLDLTGLDFVQNTTSGSGGVGAAQGAFGIGPSGAINISLYTGATFSYPSNFGTGGGGPSSVTGTGDYFGVFSGLYPTNTLVVPTGYTSGNFIQGTTTLSGSSFTSLGMNTGNYNYSWGAGAGQSFVLTIGGAGVTPTPTATSVTPTPTPTSGSTGVGWFFYSPNNQPVLNPPVNNGNTTFINTGGGNGTYNPNYTGGTLNLYFNNNNSAGTSYASQFSTLDTVGGTMTISQGSSTVIYSGTSTDYQSAGTFIFLNVNRSAQMIQSASTPFVSGTSINVVVS